MKINKLEVGDDKNELIIIIIIKYLSQPPSLYFHPQLKMKPDGTQNTHGQTEGEA